VADDPYMTEEPLFPSAGTPMPEYADDHLARLETAELWQLLIRNEDRVPRNLIDECARRGEAILDLAAGALESERFWTDDQTRGEAWLPVHAVMILGLMPDERAGALLAGYMRRMANEDDLQDWLGGYWPAFFLNKPGEQIELMKALGEDASVGCFMRVEAIEVVLSMAEGRGDAVLDPMLAWAARFVFDDKEDDLLRDILASTVLNFARPEYRAKLEAMSEEDFVTAFDRDDIERIYAAGGEPRHWAERADPWSFYSPEEIAARQSESGDEDEDDADYALAPVETYVRPTPKVGRNDPCPCGSGKKYKKCCLEADSQRS
jgi:hypothetical protein